MCDIRFQYKIFVVFYGFVYETVLSVNLTRHLHCVSVRSPIERQFIVKATNTKVTTLK